MTQPPASDQPPEFTVHLGDEIAQWEREGLVRHDQAQALRARYGLLPGETLRTLHQSRLIQLLALLGVVLVGAGVILLIGANWQEIPRWVRLALLVVATAAVYHGGYQLTYRRATYPKVGLALLLLGSLLYGASIFLIWQTFHISGTAPGESEGARAVLYWFLGVLPLAYVLRSSLHMSLALILGAIWLLMVVAQWSDDQAHIIMAVLLSVGVWIYALGRLQARVAGLQRLELSYRWVGLLGIFISLYTFGFRDFWHFYGPAPSAPGVIPYVILGLAGAAALAFLFREGRGRIAVSEGATLVALVLLAWLVMAAFTAFSTTEYSYAHFTPHELWVMALFNFLLLAVEVGLIALGWARHQPGLINFGLVTFFLQVITRYFDLLGSMRQSGLMFIGAGLLLVVMGIVLERSRHALLQSMPQKGPS